MIYALSVLIMIIPFYIIMNNKNKKDSMEEFIKSHKDSFDDKMGIDQRDRVFDNIKNVIEKKDRKKSQNHKTRLSNHKKKE